MINASNPLCYDGKSDYLALITIQLAIPDLLSNLHLTSIYCVSFLFILALSEAALSLNFTSVTNAVTVLFFSVCLLLSLALVDSLPLSQE